MLLRSSHVRLRNSFALRAGVAVLTNMEDADPGKLAKEILNVLRGTAEN